MTYQIAQQDCGDAAAHGRRCLGAMGKNRRIAAISIAFRLRELVRTAEFANNGVWPGADLDVGPLHILFSKTSEGMYFCIDDASSPTARMTGYLDPIRPGNYPALGLHVMSWRRGWEWDLFPHTCH